MTTRPIRRRLAGGRARWLAARTRNAARHGLLIAGVATVVMVAALLAFVMLPRQADRALVAALGALPPARDTMALLADRARADSTRARAEAQRAAARVAAAALAADSAALAATASPEDSITFELQQQLARARQAPLVESYRALADSRAISADPRALGRMLVLLDSIELLDRERETWAALTGPDARYAALTGRVASLGQRIVAVGTAVLIARRDTLGDSLIRDSSATASTYAADTGVTPVSSPLLTPTALPDSLVDAAVRDAEAAIVRADTAIAQARRANVALLERRTQLRERLAVVIPPFAMVLASVVMGLASGFTVSLWREMRRPTVGDAEELEQLTHTRVITVYQTAGMRSLVRRQRRGETPIPALTPSAEAWPLLHLTLSHIDDVSEQVQVLAYRPVLAGAVGLNLAAVAARESRGTVLVDAAERMGAVVPLLPWSALTTSITGTHTTDAYWDGSRSLSLGRDVAVDILLPRRDRHRGAPPESGDAVNAECAALQQRLRAYDLAVLVTDRARSPVVPPTADVVLCARLGVTPLSWLAASVRAVEEEGRRIRAVVLWLEDVPLAG